MVSSLHRRLTDVVVSVIGLGCEEVLHNEAMRKRERIYNLPNRSMRVCRFVNKIDLLDVNVGSKPVYVD